MNKIRVEKELSYAEAAKSMDRDDKLLAVQEESQQKGNGADQKICIDKKRFLPFTVMEKI